MNRYIEENKNKLNIKQEKGQLIFYHESFDPKIFLPAANVLIFLRKKIDHLLQFFWEKL